MLEVGVATTDAPPAAAGFSGFMKPAAAPSRASSRPASATRSRPTSRPASASRSRPLSRPGSAPRSRPEWDDGRRPYPAARSAVAVGRSASRPQSASSARGGDEQPFLAVHQSLSASALAKAVVVTPGGASTPSGAASGGSSRPSSAARSNASARSGGPPPRQPWAPGRYGKSDTFDEVAHARKATQAVAHARALVDLEAQVAALEKGDISADELARHLSKASAHLPAGLANRLRDMVLTTAGRSR